SSKVASSVPTANTEPTEGRTGPRGPARITPAVSPPAGATRERDAPPRSSAAAPTARLSSRSAPHPHPSPAARHPPFRQSAGWQERKPQPQPVALIPFRQRTKCAASPCLLHRAHRLEIEVEVAALPVEAQAADGAVRGDVEDHR